MGATRTAGHPDADRDEVDGVDRGRGAEHPHELPTTGWKDVALRVKDAIKRDHVSLCAAGVAFYAFLASIPALAAAISIAGLVLTPQRARELVEDGLSTAPAEISELLSSQLESVAETGGGALSLGVVVSIAVALWAASGGMQHLMEAVGVAYDEPDDRGFVGKRARALLLTVGGIVFALLALGAIAVVPAVGRALELPGPLRWLIAAGVWLVLGLGLALALSMLYRVGPDRRAAQWRWVSWGAAIAVVVWILASVGFQIYVSNFGSYNETYGSLATIVVFLMWLFLSSFAILLGAEINAELEKQTLVDTTGSPEPHDDRPIGRREAVAADTVGEPRASS